MLPVPRFGNTPQTSGRLLKAVSYSDSVPYSTCHALLVFTELSLSLAVARELLAMTDKQIEESDCRDVPVAGCLAAAHETCIAKVAKKGSLHVMIGPPCCTVMSQNSTQQHDQTTTLRSSEQQYFSTS